MKVFVFFIGTLITLKSFAQTTDPTIYKTVLQYARQKHENIFVVQDSTSSKELTTLEWTTTNGELNVGRSFRNITDTSWKELLVKANKSSEDEIKIDEIPKLNVDYLSHDELHENYKEKNGWDDFYEEHPGVMGFWQFSKVIYSSDSKRALVYVAIHRNYLSATGSVYFLSFENNEWKVKYYFGLWVS